MSQYKNMDAEKTRSFWKRVNKTNTCWFWTGGVGYNAYGQFNYGDQTVLAHRFAYGSLLGPIPNGYIIHHKCRSKRCVNPDHLQAVPRGNHPGDGPDINRNKTHCLRGHEFSKENTQIRQNKRGEKYRQCIMCKKMGTPQKSRHIYTPTKIKETTSFRIDPNLLKRFKDKLPNKGDRTAILSKLVEAIVNDRVVFIPDEEGI